MGKKGHKREIVEEGKQERQLKYERGGGEVNWGV